jgi:hypothetical protein
VDVLGRKKTYTGTIPPLTIASLIDIQLAIWKIDALAKTVPKGVCVCHACKCACAHARAGTNASLGRCTGQAAGLSER